MTLQYFRTRSGWTQSELARNSGYSIRTINKAEAGLPVRVAMISDLADLFSLDDQPVYPEDLVLFPVTLAQELIYGTYEYRRELIHKIEWFLDPDIELIFNGSPEEIPFAGVHRGIDGVGRAFDLFFQFLDAPRDCDYRSATQFLVNENNPLEVIVWGKSYFCVINQPASTPIQLQLRLLFRRGKLFHIDDRFDTRYAEQQFLANRSSTNSPQA